jgi:hypothetical protein
MELQPGVQPTEMLPDELGCGSGERLRLPTTFLLEYMGVWNLFRWIVYVLQAEEGVTKE